MIRPFTVVCMLMAVGSGLYLYQCKHQAQVLDREITRTLKQTDGARERIGMLRAEWAQLNEPERVADLARAHTGLQTAKPTQFLAMNDLAGKLPAPVAPGRAAEPADAMDDEGAPPVAAVEPRAARVAAAAPAPTAAPETKPVVHAQAVPVEPKPTATATRTPSPVTVAATVTTAAPAPVAAVQQAARQAPPPHAVTSRPVPVSAEATAPGTVGAAVLRAMRERETGGGAVPYVQPAIAAVPAPTPAAPRYAAPSYAPAPVAAVPVAPAYAPQAYAAPPVAGSMLGGNRSALPPPVPFAAR